MEITKISAKELETIYPNNSKVKLEEMEKKEKENYLSIYNMYRKLFTEYMIEILNLKKYDEKIEKSKNEFIKTEKEKMDIYQYFSEKELKYFYIRNNIYIEKLSEEEKRYIEEKIKIKDYKLSEEEKEFIKKTYKKVIFEDVFKNSKKSIILYGPNTSRFLAKNDEIIIGYRYDEFGENGLTDEAWGKQHRSQLKEMRETIIDMMEEYKQKELSVNIIKYGDTSIIRI